MSVGETAGLPVYRCVYMPQPEAEKQWPAPRAEIKHYPWDNGAGYCPPAWGQAVWDEAGLYVRLFCLEAQPLVRYHAPNDPVYKDSCLEFFVMAEGGGFFNFELNAAGTLLAGHNDGKRLQMLPERRQADFAPTKLPYQGGWAVGIKVPFAALGLQAPFGLSKPVFRCNFFKCGDETPAPHYGCWSAIDWPQPQFHLPQFFGRMVLEAGNKKNDGGGF